jgi:DNA-binding ferritin-like protein (Dps family)
MNHFDRINSNPVSNLNHSDVNFASSGMWLVGWWMFWHKKMIMFVGARGSIVRFLVAEFREKLKELQSSLFMCRQITWRKKDLFHACIEGGCSASLCVANEKKTWNPFHLRGLILSWKQCSCDVTDHFFCGSILTINDHAFSFKQPQYLQNNVKQELGCCL